MGRVEVEVVHARGRRSRRPSPGRSPWAWASGARAAGAPCRAPLAGSSAARVRALSVGEATVTQTRPSLPRAMLSGWPGRSSTQTVLAPAVPSALRCTRRMVRVPVSATSTASASLVRATPLAKHSWSSTVVTCAVGGAAEEPAGAGVLDEVALPLLDRPDPAGVAEPDRAVGGDGGVVAEQESFAVDLGEEGLEVAGGGVEGEQAAVRVADEDAAVGQVLEAERAAAGGGDGAWCRPWRGRARGSRRRRCRSRPGRRGRRARPRRRGRGSG